MSNEFISKLIFSVTIIFLILGMLASFNLWFTVNRGIPFISFFDYFHGLNMISVVLSCSFIFFQIANLFKNKKSLLIITIVNFILILLLDRMKWQPWAYFYLLVFLIYTIQYFIKKHSFFYLIKYLLGILYFWAGIHKINPDFIFVHTHDINHIFYKIKYLFYAAPYIEILLGIAISIFPLKKLLRNILLGFHTLLILYTHIVSPSNIVILLWNLYFIILIILLTEVNSSSNFKNPIQLNFVKVLLTIMILLPSLNFYDKLDAYVAFSLYSCKVNNLYIVFPEEEITPLIRKKYQKSFVPSKYLKLYTKELNTQVLDYYVLTMNSLKVPPVMEKDVTDYLIKQFKKESPLTSFIIK